MWANGWPGVGGRWGLFTALLLLTGATVFRLFVARRGEEGTEERGAAAGIARWGGILFLGMVLVRLGVQVADFLHPGEPAASQLRFLLLGSFWGRIWWLQLVLGLAALLLLPRSLAKETLRAGAWLAAVLVVVLGFTPALSGHAVAHAAARNLAILSDGVHLIAAGAWLGTLAVLLHAGRRVRRGGGDPDVALQTWMGRYHRLAILAVLLVVGTGVLSTLLHADSMQAFLAASWGRALLWKSGAVGVVLVLGWRNGWSLLPRLTEAEGPGRVRRSARTELGWGQVVLLLTAILVALSPPSEEAGFEEWGDDFEDEFFFEDQGWDDWDAPADSALPDLGTPPAGDVEDREDQEKGGQG